LLFRRTYSPANLDAIHQAWAIPQAEHRKRAERWIKIHLEAKLAKMAKRGKEGRQARYKAAKALKN
jgi:hypothetical protein